MIKQEIKKVKEVFKDYISKNDNFLEAGIKSIRMNKKENSIKMEFSCDNFITLKEIMNFEKFLENKFQIKNINTKMKYNNQELIIPKIEEDWDNIIIFINYKYPLTKAIFKDSTIKIANDELTMNLKIDGVSKLITKDIIKQLNDIIENFYNKTYNIKFIEDIKEEDRIIQREKMELAKKEAISKIKSNVVENKENEIKKEESQEETPLILGRRATFKEENTKVIDISIDSGKIVLEGEIISDIELRQLKTRKILNNI